MTDAIIEGRANLIIENGVFASFDNEFIFSDLYFENGFAKFLNGLSGKFKIFKDKIEIKIDQIITEDGFYRLKNRPKADMEKLAEYSTLLTNSLITVYKDSSGSNRLKAKGQFQGNLIPEKFLMNNIKDCFSC